MKISRNKKLSQVEFHYLSNMLPEKSHALSQPVRKKFPLKNQNSNSTDHGQNLEK